MTDRGMVNALGAMLCGIASLILMVRAYRSAAHPVFP